MVEVVFQSSNTVTVIRVSNIKLGRHTDDQVLDLGQRGGIELVGEQLRDLRIAERFAYRSDEDVLGEESTSEFLVDLLVGVEKSSGIDERLVAFDIPEWGARTDHQTLLDFVKKVSDAEAAAGGVGETIVLCLLVWCVASDEEVFIDLVVLVSGCYLEGVGQLTLSRVSRGSFKNSKVPLGKGVWAEQCFLCLVQWSFWQFLLQ